MKIAFGPTLPWVEAMESLMNASATWHLVFSIRTVCRVDVQRTNAQCNPQINQPCCSCWLSDAHACNAADSGRTRFVMMRIVLSDSTTSMNLSMSGCQMVHSLRNTFLARGIVDLKFRCMKSYSSKVSSYWRWDVLDSTRFIACIGPKMIRKSLRRPLDRG